MSADFLLDDEDVAANRQVNYTNCLLKDHIRVVRRNGVSTMAKRQFRPTMYDLFKGNWYYVVDTKS